MGGACEPDAPQSSGSDPDGDRRGQESDTEKPGRPARGQFTVSRLLLAQKSYCYTPGVRLSASASCKMLGQMLKSWNFSLSVFFLAH